jgi:ribosome-associated protein YbcJ (S4-like RNA binding protein)
LEPWKLEKIKSIQSEVADLHPLLREVFTADPSIANIEYTHGQNEMGADFVLARTDPTLGDESYIGVVVKCGSIKQDHSDVKRQIEECQVERFFSGGKAKIFITEVWVVCNGSISNGAQRKIHRCGQAMQAGGAACASLLE